MALLLVLLLIVLNGVFSLSEIALVSVRKSRLEAEANAGDQRADAALKLAQAPNQFLAAVQIGITLVGIATGAFGEARLTQAVQALVARVPALAPYSSPVATVLVVGLITYLSVVVGELLPKRIGLANPEGVAKLVAGPMRWVARLATPFIWLLNVSSEALFKLLGIRVRDNQVTEEEIQALVQEGTASGVVQDIEQDIVQNAFRLGDQHVSELMTSRPNLVWLDVNAAPAELCQLVLTHKLSVYPVADGGLDRVLGTVRSEALLSENFDQQLGRLRELSQEALYLSATTPAYQALGLFRQSHHHHALVVDEFGSVLGLLTLFDLLGTLVADPDAGPDSAAIVRRDDGSYLLDAQLSFTEFADYFHLADAERQELTVYHTLGGFVLQQLGAVPRVGQHFTWHGYYFEAVDVERSRIDRLLFRPKPGSAPAGPA